MTAALHSAGLSLALLASIFLFAGAGAPLLRLLKLSGLRALDTFLFSTALGVILLELAVTLGELANNMRLGVQIAAAAVALFALAGLKPAFNVLLELTTRFAALRGAEKSLAAALLVVFAVQGLAAMAPLTGSDALHYHFTIQSLYLANGFHADWSLLHGFFSGLSHQLVLASLAFGSTSLVQTWLFLAGALAALCALRFTQLWIGGVWPWLAALAFALTPVVFWQTTSAGAPDIWMCVFVPLSLLAILYAMRAPGSGFVVLAGILAGAAVGAKYTGLFLAAALFLVLCLALKSTTKNAAFFGCAVAVGLAPYLRNWLWTGDPVFPFFFARIHRIGPAINTTALRAILFSTGGMHTFSLGLLLKSPLFAAVDPTHLGASQFLGPLVLAFGPFALLRFWKTAEGRAVLLVWILAALAIGLTSGLPRFLLPLLPIALAASVAGVAITAENGRRVLRVFALLSLAGFALGGLAVMLVYSHPALAAASGAMTSEDYLRSYAPDYEHASFVNQQVGRLAQPGRTLVFFRHLYYLRVPFFSGDPKDSWDMNPALLTSTAAWKNLFVRHQIRWVLKSGDYPDSLSAGLTQLEREGILRPCASGEAISFSGNRIEGVRVRKPVTLFCVQLQ